MTYNHHQHSLHGLPQIPTLLDPNNTSAVNVPAGNMTPEEIKNFLETIKEFEQQTPNEKREFQENALPRDPFLDLKFYASPQDIADQGVFVPGKLYRVRRNITDGEFVVLTTPDTHHSKETGNGVTATTLLVSKENINSMKDAAFLCIRTLPVDGIFKTHCKNGVVKFLDRKWMTELLYEEKVYTFLWYENPEAAANEQAANTISGWVNSPGHNYSPYYGPSYTQTTTTTTTTNGGVTPYYGYNHQPSTAANVYTVGPASNAPTYGNQWSYGSLSSNTINNTINYTYNNYLAYKLQGADLFEEIPAEFEEEVSDQKNG